jgi:dTDP-glucose pyrophosphorylase
MVTGWWADAGTPESLLQVSSLVAEQSLIAEQV